MNHPVYPCLWFETQAKEAAVYYCSIFPNASILSENPFAVVFQLNGARFMALNGATKNNFHESISFVISCESQEEIDHYWDKLTEAGEERKCGWLTDKYGVTWQVVPSILGKLMSDPEKAPKVMYAFMQMRKLDIAKLEQAAS